MKNIFTFTSLLVFVNSFASFPVSEIVQDPNEGIYKTIGYSMGMFMLIFGVIIAYAYNNKIMIKSAWRGFLTVVAIFILFVITLFVFFNSIPEDFNDVIF
jgi:hypothetical protein